MDNKDNLDDSSTNDDPGFRSNSSTSNTQQVVSDTHESHVSPYLVTRDPSLKPTGEVTTTMDKDYDKETLSGGSTNDDPSLSTDDPGGGKHSVRSPSNTMDKKDNLDDSNTNDDPGFHSNFNTSNTQQVVSDCGKSRAP